MTDPDSAAIQGLHSADPLFVFYGAEGEYVLRPLYAEMSARGHRCVEIIAAKGRDAAAEIVELADQPGRKVLITCAHFLYDRPAMINLVGVPGCLSPIEVYQLLRPVLTVYCPHDLGQFLLEDEPRHIGLVDLYLGATPAELMLRRYTEVEIAGWLKYLKAAPADAEPWRRALWLTMSMESNVHQRGVEYSYQRMKPYLRDWCAVKFAPLELFEPLEQRLRAEGICVVDKYRSASEIAAHFEYIIINGESSTVREAALVGKPVCILIAPEQVPDWERKRLMQFGDLPNVFYIKNMDAMPPRMHDFEPILKPFAMDRAIEAIVKRIPA